MDKYRELNEHLRNIGSGGRTVTIYQGIVNSVDGNLCEVQIGGIAIPGVRLRASEADDDAEMLVTPKVGTAVTIGSLSGGLDQMVVLQVDHIETLVINGGKLGGLVNIEDLTAKLNAIEDDINSLKKAMGAWTPVSQDGGAALKASVTAWTGAALTKSQRGDYEDVTIKH